MSDGVEVLSTEGVSAIEFGSEKANSLSRELLRLLEEAIQTVGASDAKVLVLQSRGAGAFCAGASLSELDTLADIDSTTELFLGFGKVIQALISVPQLVVARVQGKAVGGGIGLIAASDYALATDQSSIKLSELSIGLGPYVIGPVLERRIGSGPFSALSIDCQWRDAFWAHRHGLFSDVLGGVDLLDEKLHFLVDGLRKYPAAGLSKWKRALWQGTEHWDQLLYKRAREVAELALTRNG